MAWQMPYTYLLCITVFCFTLYLILRPLRLGQRILNKLEEEGMLYVVPPGANDDWYWMYSTIYEGKKEVSRSCMGTAA